MNLIEQLQSSLNNLKVLRASGVGVAFEISAVEDAIELIGNIHSMVDGKEVDSGTTCDLIDALVTYGLEVREVGEDE